VDPNNEDRANRGEELLKYHQTSLLRESGEPEINESAIASVLADLRHLCKRDKLDYAQADRMSNTHYFAEQWEEEQALATPNKLETLADYSKLGYQYKVTCDGYKTWFNDVYLDGASSVVSGRKRPASIKQADLRMYSDMALKSIAKHYKENSNEKN